MAPAGLGRGAKKRVTYLYYTNSDSKGLLKPVRLANRGKRARFFAGEILLDFKTQESEVQPLHPGGLVPMLGPRGFCLIFEKSPHF